MQYYIKRVIQSIIVYAVAVSLAFAMYRLMPGGPVEIVRQQLVNQMGGGGGVSEEQMDRINALVEVYTGIRPDQPLYIQYFDYLTDIFLHLDFGRSFLYQEPVFAVLADKVVWSLFIGIYGLALGRTTGLLFGAFMAHKEGTVFDKFFTIFTVINRSIPYYITAIVLLIIFAFNLNWLPQGGMMNRNTTPGYNLPFMIGVIKHATLPILSAYTAGFGGALAFRGNCIRELGKEYIRVAHFRGVSESRVAMRYVGRNALLPSYTQILISIATVLSTSIILETIFNYPALGFVTFRALMGRDYPLIMGTFLVFTGLTVIGILIADLTYGLIDPRVKGGEGREQF